MAAYPWMLLIGPAAFALARVAGGRSGVKLSAIGQLIDAADALHEADLLNLQGASDDARAILDRVNPVLDRSKEELAPALRARAALLTGECHLDANRRAAGEERLRAALNGLAGLPATDVTRDLEAWAKLAIARLEPDEKILAAGSALESALEAEPRVHSPTLRCRMARSALALGRAYQSCGDWERSRRWYESAVQIAERVVLARTDNDSWPRPPQFRQLAWGLARRAGSESALELGWIHLSLGETETGLAWLDRAAAVLEGAEDPQGRIALARALLERARHQPSDSLEGPARRAAWLKRAVEVALTTNWPIGRAIASQAECELGLVRSSQGAIPEAAAHFRRAHELASGPDPGLVEFATLALLHLGILLQERNETEEAITELRRAYQLGRADRDLDARHSAALAGCHLHGLLVAKGDLDAARPLLEVLDRLPPTLHLQQRALIAGMVARSRAYQLYAEQHPDDAMAELERSERLARLGAGPQAARLLRLSAAKRGELALASERAADAEGHLRRALATPQGDGTPAQEQAERADIQLNLGRALLHLDRRSEAHEQLQGAFDAGRASGTPLGRATAAGAALDLADAFDASTEERRRLYESAATLGQLSGTPRGLDVAKHVPERLRDLSS